MKKIPCLFKRVFNADHTATLLNEVTLGCEWVLSGEGEASVKIDGTACMIKDGKLYARYDCKPSKTARKQHQPNTEWKISDFKAPPKNSISCQEPDKITGHWPHWVLVENQPEYKWHREAMFFLLCNTHHKDSYLSIADGTYELIGPAVGGNPEKAECHILVKHGDLVVDDVERTSEGIKQWLSEYEVEGLVFKHADGRMCKIRRRDYGFEWPIK